MQLIKKYWWVFLIVFLIILFFALPKQPTTSKGNCKKISKGEWDRKKKEIYERNGGNWGIAHANLLDEGYCEHLD